MVMMTAEEMKMIKQQQPCPKLNPHQFHKLKFLKLKRMKIRRPMKKLKRKRRKELTQRRKKVNDL